MNRILFILQLLFINNLCFSQQRVSPDEIFVNFDKVVHLVFNTPVDYVSAGSSDIEVTIVANAPNVVRVIALEEDFSGTTSVTVIDGNGKIYTFSTNYRSGDIQTVFLPAKDERSQHYKIFLNKNNAAHLVFPDDIIYYRLGTSDLSAEQLKGSNNIIRVNLVGDKLVAESNIFCYSNDKKEYDIAISDSIYDSYTYTFGSDKANVEVKEKDLEIKSQKSLNQSRSIKNEGVKKDKYEFSLNNIFIENEHLYFVFEIINRSQINFDVDFVKAFFVDQKITKNAVQQETIVDYIFSHNFKNTVAAKTSNKFVLVFNKFTIPNKKVLKIEIYEKNGGRHINFDIKNKVIMKASPLPRESSL